ncbi:hypothetical protein GA0061084_1052 [Arthrobacter sp. NIO-1057]|nr:hypothetical protein GA0061084_1052 [Arthrobacter sp. NIO-1057]
MRIKTYATALLVGVLAVLPLSPAGAAETPNGATSAVKPVVINVDEIGTKGVLEFPSASTNPINGDSSVATPALLGPMDSINCNISHNSNWNITSYSARSFSSFGGGKINLKCGNTAAGYVHIKQRHASEWAKRIASVGGLGRWDDFMSYATKSALNNPSLIRHAGAGKLCYSTPIVLTNSSRTKKVTFSPTVVVSQTTKTLITSYPTGAPNCR